MTMRTAFLPILCLLLAGVQARIAASEGDSARLHLFVGGGAGFEAGNGLHAGFQYRRNTAQIGLGALYQDDTWEDASVLRYSIGARYLRELHAGRFADTYAWTGVSVFGRHWYGLDESEDDDSRMVFDFGIGPGIVFHFGLPIRLTLDTGYRFYVDSGHRDMGVSATPTVNASLLYRWAPNRKR